MRNKIFQILIVVALAAFVLLLSNGFINAQVQFKQDLANLRNQNENLTRAYDKISIQNAWNFVIENNPTLSFVRIGIIDSGVDAAHPEFFGKFINSNIIGGVDFGNTPLEVKEDNFPRGHGTQVVGIIGANNLSGLGVILPVDSPQMNGIIAGIPSNYALEIRNKSLTVFNIIRAVRDIHSSGGRMINMSFSFVKSTSLTEEQKRFVSGQVDPLRFFAFTQAFNLLIGSYPDINFIASAGNESVDVENETPANVEKDNVLTVAATGLNDERVGFSSFGSGVDISAPGFGIYAPAPRGRGNFPADTKDYDQFFSDTSASAPMVTGVAGLIKAIKPELNPAQIKQILVESGDPIQTDKPIGPRLNAFKAVCHTLVLNCPPPAAIGAIQGIVRFLGANGGGDPLPVAEATVTLVRADTFELVAQTQSDENGFYQFSSVIAGDYILEATKLFQGPDIIGLATGEVSVSVIVGETINQDILLILIVPTG